MFEYLQSISGPTVALLHRGMENHFKSRFDTIDDENCANVDFFFPVERQTFGNFILYGVVSGTGSGPVLNLTPTWTATRMPTSRIISISSLLAPLNNIPFM